jgi:hypothetical protein
VKANVLSLTVRKDHNGHVQYDTIGAKRDFTKLQWHFMPSTASLVPPTPAEETIYQLAIPSPQACLKLESKADIPGGGIVVYLKAQSDSSSL